MKKLYRRLYGSEEGFTLMELMIVIIIIAILTAIAVPSYMVLRDRARVSAAQSEMRAIATALEMYNVDNERYPTTSEGLAALETANPPYMDPVPTKDPWGINDYDYDSDGNTYTLTCVSATPQIIIIDGQMQ